MIYAFDARVFIYSFHEYVINIAFLSYVSDF